MSGDYCDLCDLPLSTCVHGMPPAPPPAPKVAPVRTPRATRAAAARPSTPVRRAPRRWQPPEVLRPHIVQVLQAAGGELDQDAVFAALEARLDGVLLEGDRQLTPEGELRWRYAARRARQALVSDGLMTRGQPGVWQLTSQGLDASME